jgi:hypothetical protein
VKDLLVEETSRSSRTKPRRMSSRTRSSGRGTCCSLRQPRATPIPRSHSPPRTFTLTLTPDYFFDAGAITNFPSSSFSKTIAGCCSAFFFCICAIRAASATVSGRIPDSITPNATASP